ncbi:MAG: hypothetical protein GDA38_12250 [Hormoscilla sp. SP12CHS1]|nr:hypothetical protein [Hormoscilla sp. SP12CHS1]
MLHGCHHRRREPHTLPFPGRTWEREGMGRSHLVHRTVMVELQTYHRGDRTGSSASGSRVRQAQTLLIESYIIATQRRKHFSAYYERQALKCLLRTASTLVLTMNGRL